MLTLVMWKRVSSDISEPALRELVHNSRIFGKHLVREAVVL